MRLKQMICTVILAAMLVGCRLSSVNSAASSDAMRMTRTELFFGLSEPEGKVVSEQQWQAFVDETITPRFPDGFTILDGAGQWREKDGTISHERSKILLIVHKSDAKSIRKLDEIRSAYKLRFNQESVIRESGDAMVSF
ncbi:MAG TPA: DUF3574 domain-containing protein [Tepidisphaeraceae bacterium]|nr:DUF3574 domain-containing protein [Tepidisphaeraceae bacterium]